MKRITSTILIALLLLNLMGFYGIFLGLKYSNTQALMQQFDADEYNRLETVTIKVPISIPYFPNTDFERVDGEVEHQGQSYRLVKQRYTNDTLFIVCVRDVEGGNLKQALSDYVKTFTDHPGQQTPGKTVPTFIKEYLISETYLNNASAGWSYGLTTSSAEASLHAVVLGTSSPPPEV
jgi:hypothetical protein